MMAFPASLYAETYITDGYLYDGGHWTKEGSPYILEDYVSVPEGQKLSIGPGVSVMSASTTEFGEPYTIRVNGELEISGTEEEPMKLYDLYSVFISGGTSTIDYAEFKGTGINVSFGNLEISSSTISRASEGISAKKSRVSIENSEIMGNESGIVSNLWVLGPVLSSIVDPEAIGGTGDIEPDTEQNIITIKNSILESNEKISIKNKTANVIDATDNWWGSPHGPEDMVSGTVVVEPWKTEDPRIAKEEPCCSNVLFLPGLKASRLYKDSKFLFSTTTNRLWEPDMNADVEKLYLDENGKSLEAEIYVKDVVDSAFGVKNIYKSFLADMEAMVADNTINEWLPFAYDWREGVDDIASGKLISEIEKLALSSKTGKVTIVAHSNGGLVAKTLGMELEKAGKINLIDKVMFVAVPQFGTPQAVAVLLHGYGESILNGFVLKASTARTLGINMPGAYGLLPSAEFFNRSIKPVISFPATNIDSYSDFSDFLIASKDDRVKPKSSELDSPEILSQSLLAKAQGIHESIDSWNFPPSVQSYFISGWGMYTTEGMRYEGEEFSINKTLRGDGVVVSQSSKNPQIILPTAYFNQGRFNKDLKDDVEHAEILEASPVRDFISQIMKKNTASVADISLPSYLSWKEPEISDYPYLGSLVVSVHSPIDIDVYDNRGGHIGLVPLKDIAPKYPDSDIMYVEDTIGGDYEDLAGRKYITIPYSEGENYTVKLSGTGVGTFTFKIEKYDNNMRQIASTTYTDLPVTPLLVASTTLNSFFLEPTLHLDVDGDGKTDISALPATSTDPLVHLLAMEKVIKSLGLKPVMEKLMLLKIEKMKKLIKSGKDDKWIAKLKKLSEKVGKVHWKKKQITDGDRKMIFNMFDAFLDSI